MGRRKSAKPEAPISPRKARKSTSLHNRTGEESKQQQQEDPGAVDANDINVYVRLRPINKLETNKRSRDCVELHDDPALITVDAPHQGLHDFTFDSVGIEKGQANQWPLLGI